jgi:hypothetical protein
MGGLVKSRIPFAPTTLKNSATVESESKLDVFSETVTIYLKTVQFKLNRWWPSVFVTLQAGY